PVDRHALPAGRPREPDHDLTISALPQIGPLFVAVGERRIRFEARCAAYRESVGAKADDIDVAGAPRRAEEVQISDRLEEVGLALAVVANHHQSVARHDQLDVRQVAKVPHLERSESRDTHVPRNRGGRFSMNAWVPSLMSSVAESAPKWLASNARPSASDMSSPRSTASMHMATARGPLAQIAAMSARAASISSFPGTTRLTRPMRKASVASMVSPVMSSCMAR